MPSVQYWSRTIDYSFQEREELDAHYISVDRHAGVVLKGKVIPEETANRLILKKARWILGKLELVAANEEDIIVTGSRIAYLGKTFYVQVVINEAVDSVLIAFNHSKFTITIQNAAIAQDAIRAALQDFYKEKAIEKITPRVVKHAQTTGLHYNGLQFRKMNKRWGSCTGTNNIIINIDAVKLSYSLIDYLILHELVHTKVKDHSKAYWAELSKHEPKWKMLDEQMQNMKL